MPEKLFISSNFDGGNIICKSCDDASDIRLEIRKDHQSDFYQWFYFRLTGAEAVPCTMTIENAASAAYPQGWPDYRAVASYDRETWFRVDTAYKDGKLVINHTPGLNSVYYAYFAPYSMERHADLIASAALSDRCHASVLGQTLDGQDMDLLTIGEPGDGKKVFWVDARQHPGETMAEWWMEGFLDRLLDEADPVARTLLDQVVFYVVPNMNPDGARRGHLRTNAVGTNLNREWDKASLEKSPEVYHVLEKMKETGVDLSLDVHGDEALPYNFIAGAEGIEGWSNRDQMLLDHFKNAYVAASPDFQTKVGYPVGAPGSADLSICTNYMAKTFGCLAMTLEMPFKDTVETPDPEYGWSPARCARLGGAALDAMLSTLKQM
ncbi:M14 family metallopeptidase [Aquisalinus flavus]|uniref:Peptidase M14 domain-containing protein n=1 Tax=Aquisalinus flavus TaxID=1526572 RepID=A0A8J2V3V1_9PROT|nr:carboxypeptidase family protein [Aquisalinus flavus]MBD0426942.1 carboxypeptidase family protein [Aquisalinus flavus]UNE46783.1 carboxypeptidase family protein [Aquisalinus flavus]GGC97134.1 hypothetical protein GCM10011342_02550 [Aquisalinus flavus]